MGEDQSGSSGSVSNSESSINQQVKEVIKKGDFETATQLIFKDPETVISSLTQLIIVNQYLQCEMIKSTIASQQINKLNQLLVEIAKNGKHLFIKTLIELGADPNQIQPDGSTALHKAVYFNKIGCVKELLYYGADPNISNLYGETPLHLASAYPCTKEIREILIKAGAKQDVQNKRGETPEYFASLFYKDVSQLSV